MRKNEASPKGKRMGLWDWLTHDPHAEALKRQYEAEVARQTRFVRMREIAEAFEQEHGREATPREIWELLEVVVDA